MFKLFRLALGPNEEDSTAKLYTRADRKRHLSLLRSLQFCVCYTNIANWVKVTRGSVQPYAICVFDAFQLQPQLSGT